MLPLQQAQADRTHSAFLDRLVCVVAAAVALIVYVLTLAPTVSGEDSGEFITAAYSLGIPHPPGYPLWCMLGHVFTYLPYGSIAWRVNLMSAVFAAATVYLVARLILMLTQNHLAALGGAWALAFSRAFWEQAVIAEVYALNAFCLALCVVLLWRWHTTRRDRILYGFAVIYGLSLGNHNTMLLLMPLFAVFIAAADGAVADRWKAYGLTAVIVAVSGVAVYLYLPLRSLANPAMDWGNPETLENLWDVIRRKQLSFLLFENPRTVGRFLRQLGVCLDFWTWEFSPWVGVFGLLGLGALLWRRFWHGLFLLVLAFGIVAGFCLIQNFSFDKEWLWVMRVFGIPAYMVTAIGIGVGLDALSGMKWARCAVFPAALACVLSPLILHWERNDKSDYYWAADYAENILTSLEPDAIYIPDSDHGSFPAIYLQSVEGLRPKVTIGRKYGYLDMDMVADMPEAIRAELGEFPRGRDEARIFSWLLQHTDRPVYFARPPRLPGLRFEQAGLVYRALRPGEKMPDRNYWDWYVWRTLDPAEARGDYTAELILFEIALAHAKEAFSAGKGKRGLALVEEAVGHFGRDTKILNNVGVVCARFGHREAAEAYFRDALERDPENAAAARNLARIEDGWRKDPLP